MSALTINAILAFLKKLIKDQKVASYGFTAKMHNVPVHQLVNLLEANKFLPYCYVIVGCVGGTYALTSNKGICEYQEKKLLEMMPLFPVSSVSNVKEVSERTKKNTRDISDLRIIPLEYVCEEELLAQKDTQTGEEEV